MRPRRRRVAGTHTRSGSLTIIEARRGRDSPEDVPRRASGEAGAGSVAYAVRKLHSLLSAKLIGITQAMAITWLGLAPR